MRWIRWTDVKSRPGTHTGRVNNIFVPSSSGIMEYDSGAAKKGGWENGRYCKGNSSNKDFNNGYSGIILVVATDCRSLSQGRAGLAGTTARLLHSK